ncbi:DUF998 domain-containing protein [Micromonospora mirobrigensis]|uniref:DUF998 domain-containing protein n=1 Tax=Micromonospora mirobrigensis TaxID=262898 RepID=A0A1C4XR41_9ACTN|nr:DUF998 domain-containing protein [Micromonospora mirobrigensis]SCF10957.1 Protein of unknown function (DUF998) [Micromonospora mirobrigensis]
MSPTRAGRGWPAAALAVAAVLYASWLLGPLLNPALGLTTGYASELAARDQPHHLVFGLGDVLTGLLAAAAGVLLAVRRAPRVAWWGLAVFGVATVVDGGFTSMDCSPTRDARCAELEQAGGLSWRHELHSVSSALAVAGGVVSLIALVAVLRAPAWRRVGGVLALVLLAGTVTTLLEVAGPDGALGAWQRVQLVGLSGWLALAAAVAARPEAVTGDGRPGGWAFGRPGRGRR